ncbi:MAG: hypothetical protein IJQ71_06870 [Clostridia bacterium]|nr:hypothetical protein [Clostridia bacterium]
MEVEADSIDDAMDIFKETSDEIPLPTDADYVDGSFDLSCYEPEVIQVYNPDAPLRTNHEEE